jgi:hypothetical protein
MEFELETSGERVGEYSQEFHNGRRIEAIEREFGVKLTREEREGIKGRNVAIDEFDLTAQKFEF